MTKVLGIEPNSEREGTGCYTCTIRPIPPAPRILAKEGSVKIKLPTLWTDGKREMGRVRGAKKRREKIKEGKESEERRSS